MDGGAARHVLRGRHPADHPHRQLELGGGDGGGDHGGGAAHVALHGHHAGGRLEGKPAGVEGDALADQGHRGPRAGPARRTGAAGAGGSDAPGGHAQQAPEPLGLDAVARPTPPPSTAVPAAASVATRASSVGVRSRGGRLTQSRARQVASTATWPRRTAARPPVRVVDPFRGPGGATIRTRSSRPGRGGAAGRPRSGRRRGRCPRPRRPLRRGRGRRGQGGRHLAGVAGLAGQGGAGPAQGVGVDPVAGADPEGHHGRAVVGQHGLGLAGLSLEAALGQEAPVEGGAGAGRRGEVGEHRDPEHAPPRPGTRLDQPRSGVRVICWPVRRAGTATTRRAPASGPSSTPDRTAG